MLNLKVQFPSSLNANTFYKITTLPQEYRPTHFILKIISTSGNGLLVIRIHVTGEVELYTYQAGVWNVYINETYF